MYWDKVGEQKLEVSNLIQENYRDGTYGYLWQENLCVPQEGGYNVSSKRSYISKSFTDEGEYWGLSPRYIMSFENFKILKNVSYRLALQPCLARIHNLFHVIMLRKYVNNPSYVIDFELIPFEEDCSYIEQPL